jgi:hypothetical protein
MNAIEQSPVGGWLLVCIHEGTIVDSRRFFGNMLEACYKLDALNAFTKHDRIWYFEQKEGYKNAPNGD